MTARTATQRLGAILVDAQVLAPPSLVDALALQGDSGKQLGAVLVEMGLVDQQTVVAALGVQRDLPVAHPRRLTPDDGATALLPEELARALTVAPLRTTRHGLEVVVAAPLDRSVLAELERQVGGPVVQRLAPADDLHDLIERVYRPGRPTSRSIPEKASPSLDHGPDVLQTLVADAFREGASDVHIEVGTAGAQIRYRVDGRLRDVPPLPSATVGAIVRRARHLAGPARHAPRVQGRIKMTVDGQSLVVLATVAMTVQGSRVRLRIVADDAQGVAGLDQLGMPPDIRQSFREQLQRPSGLILIAGLRGSGRTATAYAAISEMETRQRSNVMLQRVISHVLPSVTQIELGADPSASVIAAAIEDLDADGVVIDELEGISVTRSAARLAQRGSLVVMTVTAVDAGAAVAHFLALGVPRLLLAGTLHAVLTQRLESPAEPKVKHERIAIFELVADH